MDGKTNLKNWSFGAEKMKHRWELHIGDDLDNLPKIVNRLKTIDFAHYDSNKSYKGREFFRYN